MISLGENLRKARLAAGLTQEALGERLSISPQAVSKWERGECLPDASLLPKLADLLGISLDRLFGRKTASFADIADAVNHWLLPLEKSRRWRQALRLGQVMLTEVSGIPEEPETEDVADSWLDEGRRDEAAALTEGFSFFSRWEALPCFTFFPAPEDGWGSALEKDNPTLWETLGNAEVRKALRAVYAAGPYVRMDRPYLERLLTGLELTDPENVLRGLETLQVVKRQILPLDGKDTELFILRPHANLLQILLLGCADPWHAVPFGTVTSTGFLPKEERKELAE